MTATVQAAATPAPTASRLRALPAVLTAHPLALSVLLAVLTCPFRSAAPGFGLDDSWGFAVHAWASGSAGDVPVTYFTYGPLGFLAVPVLWARSTYALALLFSLGVQVALCRLLLARALRVVGPLAALAVVVGLAALVDTATPELMLVAVALGVAELLESGGTRHPRLLLAAGVLVSGLALLVKFSTGLVCLGALVVAVATLAGSSPRRRAAVTCGAAAASLVVSWTAFGLLTSRPGAFPAWLHGSLQVAGGYVAMAREANDLLAGYLVLLPVGLALLGLAAAHALRNRSLPRAGSALTLAAVTYLLLREGLTRHDLAHEGILVPALLLLPFALFLNRHSRWLLVPLVGLPLVYGLVQPGLLAPTRGYDLAGNVVRLSDRLSLVVDARSAQYRAKRSVQRVYRVPEPLLRLLPGHRVHVDPWDTAAVWAYDLRWAPTAVWAGYSAYTPWLDERDAASLRGAHAPDFVLRRVDAGAIDNRAPQLETPAYQLELTCRWRQVAAYGVWQLLEPGPDRCGTPTPLGSVRLVPGQPVVVPRPTRPGALVTVRLRLDRPLSYRLEGLLLKPTSRYVTLDGVRQRLVVATSAQPLMLDVPAGLIGTLAAPYGLTTTTLAVDLPGTAVFEERSVASP